MLKRAKVLKRAKDVEEGESVEEEVGESVQTKAPPKRKTKKQTLAKDAAEKEVPTIAVTQPQTQETDVPTAVTQPSSQGEEALQGCAKLLERLNEKALPKGLRLSELDGEARVCRRLVERLNEKAFQRGLRLSLLGLDEEEEPDGTSQRIGNKGEQEDTEMGETSIEVVNGQRGNGSVWVECWSAG
jgi:hypothetical protein